MGLSSIISRFGKTAEDKYKFPDDSQVLSQWYSKTESKVYAVNQTRTGTPKADRVSRTVVVLKGADPKTFEVLEGPYAKDKRFAYLQGKRIVGADASTFELIKSNITRDKDYIYIGSRRLKGIDARTFEFLSEYLGDYKDQDRVFLQNQELVDAHAPSFSMLNRKYSKDRQMVWLYGKVLDSKPNASSFRVITPHSDFTLDKDSVFYKGIRIEGSDPDQFEIIREDYGKDGNHVYRKEKILEGKDPKTFRR